jgi:REP element-mobilizing transposase RayT
MPYTRLFYHLIWATKNRLPMITSAIEISLFAYLGQKASELECELFAINGWEDHIHLVLEIPPKLSVAEVAQRLKGASSHEFPDLYWQRGYGALTVSDRNLAVVIAYVRQQKEHHAQQTINPRLECWDEEVNEGKPGIREEIPLYEPNPANLSV